MVDAAHDTRTMLVNGGYLADNAERNLRHIDDRLFMQRLKEDQQLNDRFVYKPIITCNGKAIKQGCCFVIQFHRRTLTLAVKDSDSQFITMQGTLPHDNVEFVNLEDFLISDPNAVFDNIIQQPQQTLNSSNEQQGQDGI